MARAKNDGMFGGAASKDPNAAEYNRPLDPVVEEPVAAAVVEEPPRKLVKIPMNWGNKFAIEYSDGKTIEFGHGKRPSIPAGVKPLWYIVEALE
jgi:hypothetical protein